ncbi:MAG TPA: GspH/FimT family pseudopilin [Dyella sp.]|uniref:GspH/FimT family protein n=1 Tax=Dyella sp. TaxID=1869338 RepID=UPI002B898508|nr:GspH/FimT family pseudopilin [Dyella sp.]HUB89378.1 GspH/FimT family pseudopilin [Dyella sp.]
MKRRDRKGFGLAEQIIALAVLAVLVAIAVPALHRMLETHELRAAQGDYIAALQHARNLAVNEQVRIIFCPSRDGLRCSDDDAWSQGWLIGKADVDKDGQLLGSPRYIGRKYRDTLVIVSNKQKYIWFSPDGSASNTWQSLSFCVKGDRERLLTVTISSRGRVKGGVAQNPATSPCFATN